MWASKNKQIIRNHYHTGFTIVELLIVIVVIAILAAISIVSFTGIQEKSRYTAVRSDLGNLHTALQAYYADTGSYPYTGTSSAVNWRYSCSTGMANFIPGLTNITPNPPQAPCKDASVNNDTWLYGSDGTNYKLIHIRPAFSTTIMNSIPTELRDFRWSSTSGSWGYWTSGWASV
jgi:prepilin-type N-terminal cleavage/methylation domain-containing protein